jgi:hypothetical protein
MAVFFALCNLSLFVQICSQTKISQRQAAQAMPVLLFSGIDHDHQISVIAWVMIFATFNNL